MRDAATTRHQVLTALRNYTMSDSGHSFIPIPLMSIEEYEACNYPFKALRPYDNDGVTTSPFQTWRTAKGLVPGTKFLIRARWRGDPRDNRLAGFEVKINLSCATGHNVVLVKGTPMATEFMLLQAKCWLRDNGCTYMGLDKLDLESVELKSVTPTFLQRLANKQKARAARNAFRAATELRNVPSPDGKARRKKAFSVGDGEDDTVYLKDRETPLGGYVKDRHSEIEQVFPSAELRDAIFDEGECHLRLEPTLNSVWLRKHKRTRVEDWRMYGQDTVYREAYAVVPKLLRLGDGLRARKPKETDIAKLAPLDQEVLRWHLDDDATHQARNHPVILEKPSKLARQQYFSSMKCRIDKKLRVDISVPWEKQAKATSAKFIDLAQYPGMYSPPPGLEYFVFCPVMARRLIHELKVKLDAGRTRSIGRTHIPPEDLAPPVVRLGRLVVNAEVRQYLDKIQLPLFPYLEAHQCGVFGDVSLDEVLALTRAAAALEPVQSRYTVGDRQITVTTEYVAQGAGELRQPLTTVRCTEVPPVPV